MLKKGESISYPPCLIDLELADDEVWVQDGILDDSVWSTGTHLVVVSCWVLVYDLSEVS